MRWVLFLLRFYSGGNKHRESEWLMQGHTGGGELRFIPRQASSTVHTPNTATHTNKVPWCRLFNINLYQDIKGPKLVLLPLKASLIVNQIAM